MKKTIRMSRRLTLALVVVMTFVIVLVTSAVYLYAAKSLQTAFTEKIEYTLTYLESTLSTILWNYDLASAAVVVETAFQEDLIVGVRLLDEKMNVVFSKGVLDGQQLFSKSREIKYGDSVVGRLQVSYSRVSLDRSLNTMIWISLIFWVVSVVSITLLTHLFIGKFFRGPIETFVNLAESYRLSPEHPPSGNTPYIEFQPIEQVVKNLTKDVSLQLRELRVSEARFKKMIEKSPLPMAITDQNQDISYLNDKFTELFGYTTEDISTSKKWWDRAYPDESYRLIVKKSWMDAIEQAHREKTDIEMQEWEFTIKDRTRRLCEFYMVPLDNVSLIVINDISSRKQAEEEELQLKNRLQQSQKMESIGTLAGGIAHDFNNILTAILGYAEMARDDCEPGSTISKDLNEVLEAGNRAKGLVRQILAFSRQDDTERMILQPASIVKETITMLRPSLPTTIEISQDIDAITGLVFVDPSQLNQILMNLCTNAFHAMEDTGGKLDITLKEVSLSNEDLVHEPDVKAGTFIQLSISDSGTGIVPSVKDKIFDPYFTTKEAGKGTGMGLSMVHGIVKNYGGFISCYSELGEGTIFHVFLPTVEEDAETENAINEQIPMGRERVLFVDDEEILTKMGKTMLERLGYHVTVRNSSLKALETFQNQPDEFDIVITDQTMPGMTGSDLSRRMLQIRPDIPIILCTGYSTIISEGKAKSMGIKEFAFKPLAKKDMAKLIRKVLDVS
jgi:PAS domain S-box-containing protein